MRDRFEIEKLIGKGRTGGVYCAYDRLMERKVALRRFFSVSGDTDASAWSEQFIEFGKTLSAVRHPSIVTVYETGVDEDGAYLSMELLESGRTLEKIIKEEKQMALVSFNRMAVQILDSFSYLHSMGICHGGINTKSIIEFEGKDGQTLYKCADLGMFSMIPLLNPLSPALAMNDTALTAPELFEDQPPNQQTDVYMLGQLFFYALAGGHPLAGVPLKAAYQKHKNNKIGLLSGYRTSVPVSVVDWVSVLTQSEPESRPHSAAHALSLMPRTFNDNGLNTAMLLPSSTTTLPQHPARMGQAQGGVVMGGTPPNSVANYKKTSLIRQKKESNSKAVFLTIFIFIFVLAVVGLGLAINSQSIKKKDKAITASKEAQESEEKEESLTKEEKKALDKESLIEQVKLRISDPIIQKIEANEVIDYIQLNRFYIGLTGPKSSLKALSKKTEVQLPLENVEYEVAEIDAVPLTPTVDKEYFNSLVIPAEQFLEETKIRYMLRGLNGNQKVTLVAHIENLSVYSGVAVRPHLPEGELVRSLDHENGLYSVEFTVQDAKRFERYAFDFIFKEKMVRGEKAKFTPIILWVNPEVSHEESIDVVDR